MQSPPNAVGARPSARGGQGFVRASLLAFWALVLWGTLLDLGALWTLATSGPRSAWESLQALSIPNALLALLAFFVWLTVSFMLALGAERDA